MDYKAVITGDIVHSRNVDDMKVLLKVLKETILEISEHLSIPIEFEIYRGDSFQMLLDNPENAVEIAVLIRASLKSKTSYNNSNVNMPLEKLWDARLSIGIGEVDIAALKVVESTGQAFELSGNQLDEMKKLQERIMVLSCWKNLNEQFLVLSQLSDAIIGRWTLSSSCAVYRHLLYHETQKQIAEELNISQPAVHKRLNTANIGAIEKMLTYINKTIKNQCYGI